MPLKKTSKLDIKHGTVLHLEQGVVWIRIADIKKEVEHGKI